MQIARLEAADQDDWLALRRALWPDTPPDSHRRQIADQLAAPGRCAAFTARDAAGRALGLAEVSLRSDHVNGTHTSPVAFLEGLYVLPARRRRGVARALTQAVIDWARTRQCRELASDTTLTNRASRAVHRRLGFGETERVVFFVQPLD